MGSLYLFFHVFDTKKEVIEEMISDDEKKFFIVPTTTISFVYFLLSVQEFTLFFNFYFFNPCIQNLLHFRSVFLSFSLFTFLFLFFLFQGFFVHFFHTPLQRSSPADVERKQTQGISLIFQFLLQQQQSLSSMLYIFVIYYGTTTFLLVYHSCIALLFHKHAFLSLSFSLSLFFKLQ